MAGSIWDNLIARLKRNNRFVRFNNNDEIYPVSIYDEKDSEIARFKSMNDLDVLLSS